MLVSKTRFLYLINVLSSVYLFFIISFSFCSIAVSYNNLIAQCSTIEKEYEEILDKHKNIGRFILKNGLLKNAATFNSWSAAIYNLSPIKEFKSYRSINNIPKHANKNISNITECHNDECITVAITKKEILKKILATKIDDYDQLETIPDKFTLLKIGTHSFLGIHKGLLVFSFLYLSLWYLSQAIFLFTGNKRLTKSYFSLLKNANKNKLRLIEQIAEHNKLSNCVLFIQNIASEYFTHYIHQLIARETFIAKIDMVTIIQQVEKFFSYHITKLDLKIVLNHENTPKIIESDNEIMFIVLLNLISKAIYRSKTSSQIVIKIFNLSDAMMIEINDIGYDFKKSQDSVIQIHVLPDLVLNQLCQKIKVETEETSENETNTISVKVFREPLNEMNNNIIKLNLYAKKS